MKAIITSVAICIAATAAHSMPLSNLQPYKFRSKIAVADYCVDRCGSPRSYSPFWQESRAKYSGGYVTVRDPLIQRRPFCPFGSYVACIASGAFCIDLCH